MPVPSEMSSTEFESFDLIDKNDQFIVINKKPGISFHTENGELGIVERAKAELQLDELYPVHRLDKITSGLLILARTSHANRAISELFRERKVEKYYLAISDRKPIKKQGAIKGDMVRSRRSMWKLSKTCNNPAITQFISVSMEPGKRLYLLRPKTGKTHQVRVALNSVGASIIGDPLYSAETAAEWDRAYLHAYALKFELNATTYDYVCLPKEGDRFLTEAFKSAVEALGKPTEYNWPKK